MTYGKSSFEQIEREVRTLVIPVRAECNTTDTSIKTYSRFVPDVHILHENDGLTYTSIDSDCGFDATALDNDAAPAVFGFIATVGDAEELLGFEVIPNSIVNGGTLAMTALGTVTKKGTGSDGVTSNGNISLVFGCTGLNSDAEIATCDFTLRVTYRPTQP